MRAPSRSDFAPLPQAPLLPARAHAMASGWTAINLADTRKSSSPDLCQEVQEVRTYACGCKRPCKRLYCV